MAEADWVPELPGAADLGRRAPACWLRVNPERAAPPHMRGVRAAEVHNP